MAGEPGRSFSILLPPDGAVKMTTGTVASPSRSISVDRFDSFPRATGLIGPSGATMLYVGATRGALRQDQQSGSYSGNFVVTVVY